MGSTIRRNCLKSVILLWTGIIAFNASVTAYEFDGKDIRALRVNYCGELLKSLEVYFVDKRNWGKLKELLDIFQIPGNTGPLRHLVIPYNQSPCDEGIQQVELPTKLLVSTVKQLQFIPSLKEMKEYGNE